jgi:hypothetical protein
MSAGKHNASASAVGYQYQTNWCLLELLRRGPQRPDSAISLEMHDDVAWEDDGTPLQLLQTKHHLGTAAGLGNKDTDIWKTLLVWMNVGNPTDHHGPTLILVTTSMATPSTAAYLLREASRNTADALDLLTDAAATSTSRETDKARARFLALSPSERQTFVSRITVVDGSPTVDDIDAEVREVLWHVLPVGHEDLFLAQLWRWWAGVALDMLRGRRTAVDAGEARAYISSLRNRFGDDDLPTLVELADVNEDNVVAAHDSSIFVQQMRWVRYNPVNLRKAIVDYHRAVTQTVEWVAEDLIGLHELQRFEDNLRDEWSRVFADMIDDVGADADEETKIMAGKQLLRQLRDSTAVNVRARYNDPFFARGKRQELADQGDVGWHPDFQARLEAILTVT